MTASVDQVLRDHGLTRENAKQFVLLSPAFNRKELAEEMEISEDTAHRYRRAFREMDVAERAQVVAVLAAEMHNKLDDADVETVDKNESV